MQPMSAFATLLTKAVRATPGSPLRQQAAVLADPVGAQERLLRSLLRRASGTEWGQRYGFAALAEAPDVARAYAEAVPLHTYDDVRADAERIRSGTTDVTWPGGFRHFAVSSGTASAGKVIPVSAEMLAADRDFSIGVGLHYLGLSGDARFLAGKHLTLPGRIEPDSAYQPGAFVGEVSGLVAAAAPGFVKHLYQAVPNELLFREDWESKLRAIAARVCEQDVRLVVMVPSWALVLIRLILGAHHERTGQHAETLGEVWPNLQVFVSGGVALSSYRTLLEELIGTPSNRARVDFVETYGASEGFFAYQAELDAPDLQLHLGSGVFYEFVRMDELGQPTARRYTVADVEPGVRYALYVTTCSGLWSYAVGDVIRFTRTASQGHAPRILVAGRTSEMLDRFGEAVFSEEAREALREACEATGARVRDYHIVPAESEPGRSPGHEWLVEFETPPPSAQDFAARLDAHLTRVNRHYTIRRDSDAFEPPRVTALPGGTFQAWLRATRSRVGGQTKVPRMREDRCLAEDILAAADALRKGV